MMGWPFCVLMDGPTPEMGGNIKACSLHVGKTNLGYTFDQANPDFASHIMHPFRSILDKVPGKLLVVGNGNGNGRLELTNLQPSKMLTKSNGRQQIREIAMSWKVPVVAWIMVMLQDIPGLV